MPNLRYVRLIDSCDLLGFFLFFFLVVVVFVFFFFFFFFGGGGGVGVRDASITVELQ